MHSDHAHGRSRNVLISHQPFETKVWVMTGAITRFHDLLLFRNYRGEYDGPE